ncbi:MAG TPA: ribbon-helix-helix domain-containing protein [Candidatus Rifleibacterium sp.]|jgi:predicted DNA-binding protein|nr:ribbon-helix-helix domain-containing protein [Candidatus Rifleibacterium sp.]HQB84701.1 ribbon-helix-helix domain-containing protein [Candidatus Rifleibacterium sp.]
MERPKVTFTIDKNILIELDSIAKELGQKKSHIVEQALELYFDTVDTIIADGRLDRLASGKDKTISAEEVWKELGL